MSRLAALVNLLADRLYGSQWEISIEDGGE